MEIQKVWPGGFQYSCSSSPPRTSHDCLQRSAVPNHVISFANVGSLGSHEAQLLPWNPCLQRLVQTNFLPFPSYLSCACLSLSLSLSLSCVSCGQNPCLQRRLPRGLGLPLSKRNHNDCSFGSEKRRSMSFENLKQIPYLTCLCHWIQFFKQRALIQTRHGPEARAQRSPTFPLHPEELRATWAMRKLKPTNYATH